jgi:hypothetical protein
MYRLSKRLILLELNEINFDVVEKYLAKNPTMFPSLKRLLEGASIRTSCEKRYEELEPWIQWVSVHTSKTYAEHGVFRLGDIVGSGVPQIFEQVEQEGCRVGVVSAMNAENRLHDPAYFIPDPWTRTPTDPSWWSRSLSQAISQAVNDNAQARITARSAFQLLCCSLRFARVKHYRRYISLAAASWRKPWLKALALDLLLHDVHWAMFGRKRPNFSTLFLNTGAHIQHHYFFNAAPFRGGSSIKNPPWYVAEDHDPLADVLGLYDIIVGEYLSLADTELVLATGLAQKPYDRVKFYYRLNSHARFLHEIGVRFRGVFPRMTRDFLVEFGSEEEARTAQNLLASVRVGDDDIPLFGEIDNRGESLFVTLTYPHEITTSTFYRVGGGKHPLSPEVSFVAVKNGMHQEEGFAFFSPGVAVHAPQNGAHVANLGKTILRYFSS